MEGGGLEVKILFLNSWFKETKLVLMRNRFFISATCTEHKVQLMNIDLATLIILPVLQICDALINIRFSVENTKFLLQITSAS